MSKSGGEKRATGGGDDQESSRVQQTIPTDMEFEKESKTLRLLQGKYGEDFGSLVDEIYMSVFGLHKNIEMGKIHDYQGIILDLQIGGLVHIKIQKMIESLSDWNVSTTRNSPAKSDLFDIVNEEMSKRLHRGIAKLLYLAIHTRTDILCSTILLMSRFQLLTVQGLNKFLDILTVLKGTVSIGILLDGDKNNRIRFGVHDSTSRSRSHCDTLTSYGRDPNFVRSNFLKEVCIFSSKAEHMQLTTTVSIAARERNFAKRRDIAQMIVLRPTLHD